MEFEIWKIGIYLEIARPSQPKHGCLGGVGEFGIWNLEVLIGHQRIIKFLVSSIKKNRLAHAYLFVGPEQIGKRKVALEFVEALQCEKSGMDAENFYSCGQCKNCLAIERGQHPDVLLVGPVLGDGQESEEPIKSQEIKIEQIRQIQHQLSLSPFWAKRKVVIIDAADQMSKEAGNSLLKTLEEPSKDSLLILASSAWQRLLPTIVSRCQLIKFLPVEQGIIIKGLQALGFKDKSKIEQAVRFCCGRPGVAIKLLTEADLWARRQQIIKELEKLIRKDLVIKFKYAQELSQDTSQAQEVLAQWLICFRDQFLTIFGQSKLSILDTKNIDGTYPLAKIYQIIKNIQQAQELLKESSFNTKLILENLMLKI